MLECFFYLNLFSFLIKKIVVLVCLNKTYKTVLSILKGCYEAFFIIKKSLLVFFVCVFHSPQNKIVSVIFVNLWTCFFSR